MWADLKRWLSGLWPWQPRSLGQQGERLAVKHLRRLGYKIVGTGVRNSLGELDIVAVDGRTIVFVEVRSRSGVEHGHPAETVDAAKQQRLTRLALVYLKRRRLLNYPARFDVVTVIWHGEHQPPTLEHFRAAFEASGFNGLYS